MRPTARRSIDRRTGAVQALVAALALSGCGGAPGGEPDGPEPVGEAIQAETVAEAVQNGCSTASVKALAQQVVEQADCATPGAYVAVPAQPNVDFGAAVFAYLEQPARDADARIRCKAREVGVDMPPGAFLLDPPAGLAVDEVGCGD